MPLIQTLKGQTLNALFSLPEFAKRRLAGAPIRVEGNELDLDIQLLLKLASLDKPVPLGRLPAQLRASRQAMQINARLVAGKTLPMQTRDVVLGTGELKIPARLYIPRQGIDALLIYFHGGGWVQGNLDSHDNLCRHLALNSGAHVLSVEYRKAPEYPWPVPLEDAVAAYEDAVARLPEWGVTRPLVAIGGDSAGANIATVVSRRILATGLPQPRRQLLIYPGADASRDHPSRLTFSTGFFLTLENIRFYENCYIPNDDVRLHPDISPLLASEVAGLPPAIIITAGFDPLRDEGRAYANHLEQSGVAVKWIEYSSQVHGFANMLCSRAVVSAVAEFAGELRVQLS